ncbi:hypothetical protein AAII07_04995 [Microvirga sp. 0TCS3.31]
MSNKQGPSGVDIEPATLRWVGSTYHGCFLTFVPVGDELEAKTTADHIRSTLARTGHASIESNIRVAAVIEGDHEAHLRLRYDDATRADVQQWTLSAAQAMSDAGLSGTLHRPLPQYSPAWVTAAGLEQHAISTFYLTRAPVTTHLARQLTSAHHLHEYPHHILSQGSRASLRVRYSDPVIEAIPSMLGATLKAWSDDPKRCAEIRADLSSGTGWTPRDDRTEEAEDARTALTTLAPHVHHAFARVTKGRGHFVDIQPPPSGISPSTYVQRRELWPDRVLDAHGLQILTREHLDRASSLTDWHTRQVGDRYLVAARDLDPWFAGDRPDPETLARARTDFGPMIITQVDYDEAKRIRVEQYLRELELEE